MIITDSILRKNLLDASFAKNGTELRKVFKLMATIFPSLILAKKGVHSIRLKTYLTVTLFATFEAMMIA